MINNELAMLALQNLDAYPIQCFQQFLDDFGSLSVLKINETKPVKISSLSVQNLIEQWVEMTQNVQNVLHKRILDFQEDFHLCYQFVRHLPSRINSFWQGKIRAWYMYAKKLFTHTYGIASCAQNVSNDEIRKAFQNRHQVLGKKKEEEHACVIGDPDNWPPKETLCSPVVDINENIDRVSVEYEVVTVSNFVMPALSSNPVVSAIFGTPNKFDCADDNDNDNDDSKNPLMHYDSLLAIQEKCPENESGNPNKSFDILVKEQLKKTNYYKLS